MAHQDKAKDKGRWESKAVGLIAAGGAALLAGLVMSICENAPNFVPLTGVTLLVLCYGAAAIIVYRHA